MQASATAVKGEGKRHSFTTNLFLIWTNTPVAELHKISILELLHPALYPVYHADIVNITG